jgi:hypothetical protein
MAEIYFDLTGSGFLHHPEGYTFQGGPGRVFFDTESKAFLRIEPVGGTQPAQAEPEPQPAKTTRKDKSQ